MNRTPFACRNIRCIAAWPSLAWSVPSALEWVHLLVLLEPIPIRLDLLFAWLEAFPPPLIVTVSQVPCLRYHWHYLPYIASSDFPVRYASQKVDSPRCQLWTFRTHYLYIHTLRFHLWACNLATACNDAWTFIKAESYSSTVATLFVSACLSTCSRYRPVHSTVRQRSIMTLHILTIGIL